MLKRVLPILCFTIPLILSTISCKSDKSRVEDPEAVDTLRFRVKSDSVVLEQDFFEFKFKADLPIDAEGKNQKAARKLILRYVDGKFAKSKGSIPAIMQTVSKNEWAEHKLMLAEYSKEEIEEDAPYLHYSHDLTIQVKQQQKKFVTYEVNSYLYTGGAHGNYFVHHATIDLTRGYLLEWDDYFAKEVHQQLLPILREALIKQYYKGSSDIGFISNADYFSFSLPGSHPALLAEGVMFDWQPYEIDSFAMGQPHCVIPYEKVFHLLRPEIQQLVSEFADDNKEK